MTAKVGGAGVSPANATKHRRGKAVSRQGQRTRGPHHSSSESYAVDLAGLHRHDRGMFTKFRSRRQRRTTVREPEQVAPAAAPPALGDAEVLVRVERLRAALRAAGFSLDEAAGPEPVFFGELRAGRTVDLGRGEQEAVMSYLGGIPASYVLADEPHAEMLRRIEAEGIRLDLRRDGFEIQACQGSLPDDPEAMRRLSAYIRQQVEIAVASVEAGKTPPPQEPTGP